MTGELDGRDDRARLRISDAERHRVAGLLRDAAGDGRLDMDELDERLDAAYAAKTYGDLVPLTADLPAGRQHVSPSPARPPLGSAVRHNSSIAIMSSSTRRGAWEIGESHTAVAVMGGVQLDLRDAVFTARETVIRAFAFWGGIDIYVNAGTRVVVDGVGVMGGFEQTRDKVDPEVGPDSPVVRVTGVALMAGVTVQRRPPRSGPRRALGH
jgi:hypothetical protein